VLGLLTIFSESAFTAFQNSIHTLPIFFRNAYDHMVLNLALNYLLSWTSTQSNSYAKVPAPPTKIQKERPGHGGLSL
jgi:hypothetical protein